MHNKVMADFIFSFCELNHQILCKLIIIEDCLIVSLEHINYEYIIWLITIRNLMASHFMSVE